MSKRKRRKIKKSKTPASTIPDTANPIRFVIFLAIGLILFGIFMYYAILRANG